MRAFILAALAALLPLPAAAQFSPYGVTTYPGYGQTSPYGSYGAVPNAGLGGYGYSPYAGGSYGALPGGYYGPGQGGGIPGGNPYDPNSPLNQNAIGTAYAVPGSQNGAVPNPDDVMTLGRVQNGAAAPVAGRAPSIPAPGAPVAALEKPDPKGRRFEGVAYVIDGNTMALSGEVVVLDGADAPEAAQTCTDKGGLEWRCGDRARSRLVSLAHGKRVVCTGKGAAGNAVVATCLHGTTDLGRTMVADGWAMSPKAVSPIYVADESAARADRRGIWDGTLQAPWTYRNSR